MPRRILSFAGAALLCGTAFAAPESYVVDSRHTFPSFEVSHLGFSTQRGRFNRTTGRIVLDREAKRVSAEIVIDATSIDTGLAKLEAHLRSADFFDVANHPDITFRSTGARFEEDTLVALEGLLTMRGQTRPVRLNVERMRCGRHPVSKKQVCGAEAVTTIRRSDFGITYGIPAVSDEVTLRIQIEAHEAE